MQKRRAHSSQPGPRTKRRSLFRLTGGALAAAGWSSSIVQAEELRARRIGILASSPLHLQSLKQRLAELGWVEGTNAYFTERWAQADDTAYPALASALA